MDSLIKDGKISRAITVTNGAAGTSAISSAAIDMQGFESVLFIVQWGAITSGAATSIKVQQSSDDGGADDYSDLAGTAQTIADTDDETVSYVEIIKPTKRYLKLYVSRATQNAVLSAIAIQHHSRKDPVSQGSSVNGEFWVSPAEGTA